MREMRASLSKREEEREGKGENESEPDASPIYTHV